MLYSLLKQLDNLSLLDFYLYQSSNSLLEIFCLFMCLFFSILLVSFKSINPIHSVIIFILVVISAALFIAVYGQLYFLSFALVLIYIGAISILFIFTLMVIDFKSKILKFDSLTNVLNTNFIFHFFFYFLSFFYFYFTDSFFTFDYSFFSVHFSKEFFFNYFYSNWNDILVLGFYLFNYRFIEILILTFLLISGMICSISIVLSKTFSTKAQTQSYQLSHFNYLIIKKKTKC